MSGLLGALEGFGKGISEVGRDIGQEMRAQRLAELKAKHAGERDERTAKRLDRREAQRQQHQLARDDLQHSRQLERDAISNRHRAARDKELAEQRQQEAETQHQRTTERDKAKHQNSLELEEVRRLSARKVEGMVTSKSGQRYHLNQLADIYAKEFAAPYGGGIKKDSPSIMTWLKDELGIDIAVQAQTARDPDLVRRSERHRVLDPAVPGTTAAELTQAQQSIRPGQQQRYVEGTFVKSPQGVIHIIRNGVPVPVK